MIKIVKVMFTLRRAMHVYSLFCYISLHVQKINLYLMIWLTYLHKNYITLCVCAAFCTLLSYFVLHLTGVRGARNMHSSLLNNVIRVPMRFFDTNPSGRIVNRFSSDICQIDQKIPPCWESYLHCALSTLAAIIVNCIVTPYFILAALPVLVLYILIQKFFTATARELQRLDSITKSPIFSHLSETLSGIQTIRAYKVQSRFRNIAFNAIDTTVVPFLFNQTANRWLGIRLDYMGAILVFVSALTSLSASSAGNTEPAFIGLCIAYALMVRRRDIIYFGDRLYKYEDANKELVSQEHLKNAKVCTHRNKDVDVFLAEMLGQLINSTKEVNNTYSIPIPSHKLFNLVKRQMY